MPKVKKFNIDNFVNEAAEGVKPQSNYGGMASETTQPVQEQTKRGRKKSRRTIPRENGNVMFFEQDAFTKLSLISLYDRVDKQDVVRTALEQFLKKYFNGTRLTPEGLSVVSDYIARTTEQEG